MQCKETGSHGLMILLKGCFLTKHLWLAHMDVLAMNFKAGTWAEVSIAVLRTVKAGNWIMLYLELTINYLTAAQGPLCSIPEQSFSFYCSASCWQLDQRRSFS